MQDKFGRKIDYLRISLTDRCNLRCIYCMPEKGVPWQPHDQILRIEEIARFVRLAAQQGVRKVRLTGGEPLVRKGVVDLVRDIAATPGIEDVSLTTNGILLPEMARDLKDAGLWFTGLDWGADAKPYTKIDFKGRVGLVVGAEGRGISRLVRETCDFIGVLPMPGGFESLNAGVAAGVALYEILRQRA